MLQQSADNNANCKEREETWLVLTLRPSSSSDTTPTAERRRRESWGDMRTEISLDSILVISDVFWLLVGR